MCFSFIAQLSVELITFHLWEFSYHSLYPLNIPFGTRLCFLLVQGLGRRGLSSYWYFFSQDRVSMCVYSRSAARPPAR